jgi:hypothetical protein
VCISAGAGLSGGGRLRDVSMSGAFLETALPLPLYSQLAVAIPREPDSRRRDEFIAIVVRREPGGVGIEWLESAEGSVCRMLGCEAACALGSGQHG